MRKQPMVKRNVKDKKAMTKHPVVKKMAKPKKGRMPKKITTKNAPGGPHTPGAKAKKKAKKAMKGY